MSKKACRLDYLIREFGETTSNMYAWGWDERNGGNISILVDEDIVLEAFKKVDIVRDINLGFEADPILRNKYLLVTGTGKYFKNVEDDPWNNLGLVKISEDGKVAHLIWGFEDGGRFTSEFPAHLMSHAARLKINPKNRVIMHTHPTYTIAMGACTPVDEIEFTKRLWTSNTEAVVVFPEGIGVLPCMLCGTNEIGEATAKKMEEYRIVSWTNHGIYGCGETLDEAFGLIETVEKTAEIYMLSLGHVVNVIPEDVIVGLAKLWKLKTKKGIFKKLDELK